MIQANVFKTNKGQTVVLPKTVAFPDDVKKVDIIVQGRARLIVPTGESWDSWFDEGVTDDSIIEREQPEDQEREPF